MNIATIIAAFFAAVLGSLGMGGGGVLLIYLTVFQNMAQLDAQGMNLLFFLPIAALSLLFHAKNKLVEWKVVLPSVLCGLIGVPVGSWIAWKLWSQLLSKAFALFLIYIGCRELFSKKQQEDPPQK